jgi:two-component system sensor histidine kinase YesM
LMKSWFRLTLRTQLVASFLVIILITLFLGYGYMYTGMLEIEKRRTEAATIKQFKQMEFNISNFTNEVEKLSFLIVGNTDVQDFINQSYFSEYDETVLKKRVLDMFDGLLSNYNYTKSIFIFSEDARIIGSTGSMTFTESGKTDMYSFYNSAIYEHSKNSFFRLNWELGDEKLFFNYGEYNSNSGAFLSAVKAIKWPYGSKKSATLVINIDEKALNSIYQDVSEYQNSSMYIIDQAGTMISNNDMTLVGKISGIDKQLNPHTPNGSVIINQNNSKKQVIYYHLQNYNWRFIHEIPLDDYIMDILALRKKVIIILLVSFVLAIFSTFIWMNRITKPLKIISAALNNMELGQIGFKIEHQTHNEFGILIRRFNKMSTSIADLINENKKIEELKRVKEIEALQSQINPHFLYNTLSFIKWMAVAQRADNIVEAITSLGNILVPIYRSKSPLSSVSEEINYVKNYIRLINLRFGDGIKVSLFIEDGILNFQILKFILQPVVENAIFHGFDNWFNNNTIILTGAQVEAEIVLTIEDNGKGIDQTRLKAIKHKLLQRERDGTDTSGFGLNNINSRLIMHFGEQYAIQVHSSQGLGTKVVIRLPIIH